MAAQSEARNVKHWDRGFNFRSRDDVCVCVCVCAALCRQLPLPLTTRSGSLPTLFDIHSSKLSLLSKWPESLVRNVEGKGSLLDRHTIYAISALLRSSVLTEEIMQRSVCWLLRRIEENNRWEVLG